MADFPSISPPNGLQQKTVKPADRKTSAAGYTMARAKATLAKKEFQLLYNFLTKTERNTLQTFFDGNQGLEFNWTHPETGGSTYQVVFAADDIEFSWVSPDRWSIKFVIKEV